jgi:hypothetical protein
VWVKAASNIMQRVSDGAELMIGEASLASLYKTCLKCFRGFKLRKRNERGFKIDDVQYIKPQVSSLQTRLENWGKYLNVVEPGKELPALRERWQEEKVVVGAPPSRASEIYSAMKTSYTQQRQGRHACAHTLDA